MRVRTIFIVLLAAVLGSAKAQKKGEVSIAAGPMVSFPLGLESGEPSNLRTGLGAEMTGQCNFSNKSAIMMETALVSWGVKDRTIGYETDRLSFLTLHAGYQYQIGTSGFFINGRVGVDIDLEDGFGSVSFPLGAGKRFITKHDRFIDFSIDFVGADAEDRLNIKILFSLFRSLAKN